MLTHTYSYDECLRNSLKVAWKEEDVLRNRDFDYAKRFLPNRLAGVDGIGCLGDEEKLKLNQIIGNAYCHIFAFVEEYIIPQVMEAAQRNVFGDEARLRVLLRFAEDESKHQLVLGKSRLCSLLLTSMIEWYTQMHYVEHVRSDENLDELFRDLVKFHWLDEATHAVEELLELGGAIDGLLSQQADLDIESPGARDGATLHGDGARGDQGAHPARVPLDVHRLRSRAPHVRPDRRRAHEGGSGTARRGRADATRVARGLRGGARPRRRRRAAPRGSRRS